MLMLMLMLLHPAADQVGPYQCSIDALSSHDLQVLGPLLMALHKMLQEVQACTGSEVGH